MSDLGIRSTLFPTSLGHCAIAWRGETVVGTRLPDAPVPDTARRLAARPGAADGPPPSAVRRAIAAMTALLDGEPADLTFIACDLGETDPFDMQVYAVTRVIRAGETATYGGIAAQMGDTSLARRVGQALGRNPLPIIVPCHRVLGADGKLVGFSGPGGVETKLRMLAIEKARIGRLRGGETPGLFDDLPLALKPRV